MPGANLTMNDMQELRGVLGQIRDEQGETRATLEFILKHLEKLNGRTGKSEERIAAHDGLIERGRGIWWGVSVLASVIGAASTWIAKHFIPILFVAALHGQTTVRPDQLRAAAPDAPKPTLIGYTSTKGFQPVTLGAGIGVVQTATGWIIDALPATFQPPTLTRTLTKVLPDAAGAFPLSANGALFRNGLLMTAGVDYTWAAGKATPKAPWSADDIVVAEEIEIK